ncbi:BON domain-containing protein [Flavobacteriaceae bacterium TP-CH-4]|uniref:BON domain-containing protein n=1 Tax=Pelagihabitans pacificus TaxID=2696054 RepID=A0A967ASM9_9FLAO|nr:BON domain-containing protein [Pelagihabitans pacificus]NHF59624.1 BON domain-containing protein [Pelagihabitans pacificus]
MKTDAEIRRHILDELAWLPGVDESHIGVTVEDGIVTLSGTVDEHSKKVAAHEAVKCVAGVKAVAEDIEIVHGEDYSKTDNEIAKAAVSALEWNASVPKEKVMVLVEDGYIYLTGNVPWEYQKKAAQRTVENLRGVRGVINTIEIIPTAEPSDVENEIKRALERSANLEEKGIRVQVDGRTVQLKGRVHSLKERELAEKAAYKAPGVQKVQNDIVVQIHPAYST